MQVSFFADFALAVKKNLVVKMSANQKDGAQGASNAGADLSKNAKISTNSQSTQNGANSNNPQSAVSANDADKANLSANFPANSSDESAKMSLIDDISALNFTEKAKSEKASSEKSELDELLDILYERLEQLKAELDELSAKMSETTDDELRLELMSQMQSVLTEMQNIMAQIIKILREALLTQSKQQQQKIDAKV